MSSFNLASHVTNGHFFFHFLRFFSFVQVLCNGGGLDRIPDDLPVGVEHLSLTKNNIRQLKTDSFQRYKSLRKLYLDGNAITHVQAFAFRGLTRLVELSLQNTPLERLGQFTFSGLHNLTHLYLANNNIRRIESYAFAGTSAIRLLVLTNNPTVRIDTSAFAGNFSWCQSRLPSARWTGNLIRQVRFIFGDFHQSPRHNGGRARQKAARKKTLAEGSSPTSPGYSRGRRYFRGHPSK